MSNTQDTLRIGLVGTAFARQAQRGGLANYFRQLVRHLAESDPENHYTLLLHPHSAALFQVDAPNFHTRVVPIPGRQAHYWEQLLLPLVLAALPLDLVHFVGFPAVLAQRKPTVITLHDLSYKALPHLRGDWLSRFHWRFFGDRGARRADHVITISEHSRRDIQRLLGIPAERISVIYEAPAPIFRPITPESARAIARDTYGIAGRYLLFVGTLQPTKNLARLIDAYALARQRAGVAPALVIVGQKGWDFADLFARVRALELEDQVLFTGYVPDDDLPALYSGAEAFVLPSLYEGFGLPVLEAMACGAPVITSTVTSLPEVVGDAALLVDPTDTDALAGALAQICTDAALRQRLRLAGLARAAQFSWRRCAEETLAVYQRVATAQRYGLLKPAGLKAGTGSSSPGWRR